MLTIRSNDQHLAEKRYVFQVVVQHFLGIEWRHELAEGDEISIRHQSLAGELMLPDTFFSLPASEWLQPASLPREPLATWDSSTAGFDIAPLLDRQLPIIYGSTARSDARSDDRADVIALPLDLFGSIFFMLTRYEEHPGVQSLPLDGHDRFPSTASLAYRGGFLDRPLVDEYVEVLWGALRQLWPSLTRRKTIGQTYVSCDVDRPFAFNGTWGNLGRRWASDLLKYRSLSQARNSWLADRGARRGDFRYDPFRNSLDWMMEVNERAGNRVGFYFIPENTDPQFDNHFGLDLPSMRALIRQVDQRGHEIGIHPGYHTYRHPAAMASGVARLRRVLEEEGISDHPLGGRQHYLRWENPTTPRLWEENGLAYDSTLSYADRPGFRCGTCREYPFYDLERRCSLNLLQRPLILMECSVISPAYLGMGYSEQAWELMNRYREICYQFGGNFTLLWHNSHFTHPADKRFYQMLIARD